MSDIELTPKSPSPQALTLADITVTYQDGNQERRLTGTDLTTFIELALAERPSGYFRDILSGEETAEAVMGLGYLLLDVGGASDSLEFCGSGLKGLGQVLILLGGRARVVGVDVQAKARVYRVTVNPVPAAA